MLSRNQQSDTAIKAWTNNGALTKRMVDVINQCKYLASKKGMTLKELRKSLREDEARQRKLVRQNDYNTEMMMLQFLNKIGKIHNNTGHASCHPNWAIHSNNDGNLYSRYNVDTYGRGGCVDWTGMDMESDNTPEQKEEKAYRDESNENMMNLLYFASHPQNDKGRVAPTGITRNLSIPTQRSNQTPRNPPFRTGGSSGLIKHDTLENIPVAVDECDSRNSLDSNSYLADLSRVQRPVRKMGSHDLTSLRKAEELEKSDDEEDLSYILMTNEDCSKTENSDGDDDNLNDENLSLDEEQQNDDGKQVVSPLLKKVENAFADLQKNDSLFGNMDDFGHLMEKML